MGQKRNKYIKGGNMKRKLIAIDGGEGSGTTNAVACLAEQFGGRIVCTREPGGSPRAEEIRDLVLSGKMKDASPEEMYELFCEANEDHVRHTIVPALKRDRHVITDRFDSSRWAYQVVAQGGTSLRESFWERRKKILAGILPVFYILLDVDPEIGLARAKNRGGDLTHFDKRKLDFHKRVREGFLEFMTYVPHTIVNAAQSKEDVESQVFDIVSGLINGR
jgi:dTMP kinase